MAVYLWVETCGEVKLRATYLEQLFPKFPSKARSGSLMICLDNPQYFTRFLKNNLASFFAVQTAVVAMKVAYFENFSTTTMIVPNSSDFSKEVMKSKVRLSRRHFSTSNGSSNPSGSPCLVVTQDKSAHSTRCHLLCVAKNKHPRSSPLFFTAPDAKPTGCCGFP